MNILTNSLSKRGKANAFHMLSNSNQIKEKKEKRKNIEGINVINGINNETNNKKVNFFKKPKIYNVNFYYMYNQNFSKEEENLFKSFDYFTRNSKNKIKSGTPSTFHILLGKDFLKDSTYIFSIIPKEEIIINSENGINKFSNVCMIHLGYSAESNGCLNRNIVQFPEFPVFHLEFNTNKSIKFCNENDNIVKNIINLITENSVYINRNNSLSKLEGSILKEENINYSSIEEKKSGKNINIGSHLTSRLIALDVFETKSLILKLINNAYYKLFQKNPKNTLFIKKELLNKMFDFNQTQSLFLKEELFNKLKEINPNFILQFENILTSNIYIEGNNVKISQKSMENYGSGFLEFYKNKKNEFKSDLLKKYLMALYYMENLKHRNVEFEINSNLFKNKKELQNSYYLGFDLEYIIINHLKKNGKNKSLLIPFVVKYDENKNIIYYLYIINNEVYLYEILNKENERNVINKINNKVENYFKRIFSISFLSKSPLKYVFKGLVRKNMEFKINFVDENKLILLYSHLHLFYKIVNPQMELKQILENKGTDEMLKFITLLLEL